MRIVNAVRLGGPEVLVCTEAPAPSPRPGELVVGVSVAEILFLDTQLRSGWGREYFDVQPPYVPGTGVGGTVIAAGSEVDADWIGRRVVARTGDFGGYAEQVAVAADEVFDVPDGVSSEVATAALHDGPTASSRLERADLQPGEHVLVNAAAGGLAAWLIPLARQAGARVIGAARGGQKLSVASEFGAEHVVDYSQPGWQQRVHGMSDRIDVVFDGTGGDVGAAAYGLLSDGGRFFGYGAAAGTFAAIDREDAERRRITVFPITDAVAPDDQRRLTVEALTQLAAGTVEPVIGQTFPLERAAEAHTAIERRLVSGKSLLTI